MWRILRRWPLFHRFLNSEILCDVFRDALAKRRIRIPHPFSTNFVFCWNVVLGALPSPLSAYKILAILGRYCPKLDTTNDVLRLPVQFCTRLLGETKTVRIRSLWTDLTGSIRWCRCVYCTLSIHVPVPSVEVSVAPRFALYVSQFHLFLRVEVFALVFRRKVSPKAHWTD